MSNGRRGFRLTKTIRLTETQKDELEDLVIEALTVEEEKEDPDKDRLRVLRQLIKKL